MYRLDWIFELIFSPKRIGLSLGVLATACIFADDSAAQRPRFPDFYQSQQTVPVQNSAFTNQGPVFQGIVTPANQSPFGVSQGIQAAPPPATIIAPSFDPFQSTTQPLPFNTQPGLPAANSIPTLGFQAPGDVQILPPLQPGFDQQPLLQQPNQPFPRTPQTGEFYQSFTDDFLPRLLERPRLRYTWLPGGNGDSGNELQIMDTEISTTLTLPRFLFIQQPVRITPGFIGHFWDGPITDGPLGTGFDLPANAFSAFLNAEHFSNPNLQAGIESNITVGVYSDYEHVDSDSVRFTGVGLGWYRLDNRNIFKFGAEYLDRIDVKLLPAFGMFIRPTPDLALDVYFPRPRIAQRLPSYGPLQLWSYVYGEYGGGNWTVERIGGLDDRIDINDFRAIVGLEWIGPRNVSGFIETGYVFDRELVSYENDPSHKLDLKDTIILRMGVSF